MHEHARHSDPSIVARATDVRLHHYGKLIADDRRRAKALQYLELGFEKCRQEPTNAHAFYELGIQLWELGRQSEALVQLDRCLELTPMRLDALVAAASIHTQRADYRSALKYLVRALEIDPSNPRIYVCLPSVLLEMGDTELASRVMAMAQRMEAQTPALLVNWAVYYMRCKQWHHAIASCRRALAINPAESLAHLNMGIALMMLGRHAEARESLSCSLSDDMNAASARRKLGELALMEGPWADAAEQLSIAVERGSDDDDAWLQLTIAYLKCGRKEDAAGVVKNLDASKARDPKQAAAIKWCLDELGVSRA